MTKLFARCGAAGALVVGLLASAPVWADAGSDAPAPTAAPTAPAAPPAIDARKACTDAMNADPQFAAAIVKVADEKAAAKRDQDTLDAHNDAFVHIQKNEKHVIYAYAAMWVIAALFVVFLWRRQQALNAEIASLRRDLDAATGDDAGKGRA